MFPGSVRAAGGSAADAGGCDAADAAGAHLGWAISTPRTPPGQRRHTGTALPAVVLAALFALACRAPQKMADQPRYDSLEASTFFGDGMSARPQVPGTIARGQLRTGAFLHTGKVGGAVADAFPFAVTDAVMRRGRERYDIYCSMCHGYSGKGDGMIVRRGFRRPPSLHDARLRSAAAGHIFDVTTNGFGSMPPYGGMIPPADRWAIVAYVRALQASQVATIDDVPAAQRPLLDLPAAPRQAQAGGTH